MDLTEEVRAIADTYLSKVKRSGPNDIMAVCPFHRKLDGSFESRPSFAMSLLTGLYFCHSCQEKGNLYTFLREVGVPRDQIENGYRVLIDQASRNLPKPTDPTKPNVVSLSPIPAGLLGLLDFCPTALVEDGFEIDTLRRFEVGFDDVHKRITFPLRDLSGQLVGISGRDIYNRWPKYKIYDEEYVVWGLPPRIGWDKRTVLWNAHRVYPAAFLSNEPVEIVVVEGFKACMWAYQSGLHDTVALLGTYLSQEQQWILERMGATIYLFGDNNIPGWRGTVKTGMKLQRCLRVKVMEYPERLTDEEDAQPDSLTVEEMHEAKRAALDFPIWSDKHRSFIKEILR